MLMIGLNPCRQAQYLGLLYNSEATNVVSDLTTLIAQEALDWTDGRAVYASGTAFPAITRADGSQYVPSQANNSLIFPGKSPMMLVPHGAFEKIGRRSVATG